jgi:hypothetical protein
MYEKITNLLRNIVFIECFIRFLLQKWKNSQAMHFGMSMKVEVIFYWNFFGGISRK